MDEEANNIKQRHCGLDPDQLTALHSRDGLPDILRSRWTCTNELRFSGGKLQQLWVQKEVRVGDVRAMVTDHEWRAVPEV